MMMNKPTRLGSLQGQLPSGRGTLLTPWTTLSASQMPVALHSAPTTKPGGRKESQPAPARRILSLPTHHPQWRLSFNRTMLILKNPMSVPRDNAERAKANSRESPWKQSMPLSCRNPSLPMRRGHPGALLQRLDLQIQATIMLSIKLLCQMKWTWIELRRSITGIVEQHVYSLLLANGRQHANPNRQHVILRREAAMTSDGLHRQSQRSPIVRRFSSPRCH